MATTNQRTAMVQIPLSAWGIFCAALDSGAVPEAQIRPFTHLLLGEYFPETRTNGAAGNAANVDSNRSAAPTNQQEMDAPRTRKASNAGDTITKATQGTRTRTNSRRGAILSLVQSEPHGLSRGQILERMGLKGEKSGEMSISNALTGLTKGNELRRENGKYFCVIPGGETTAAKNVREPALA